MFISAGLIVVAVLVSFGVVAAVRPTARRLRSRIAAREVPSWLVGRSAPSWLTDRLPPSWSAFRVSPLAVLVTVGAVVAVGLVAMFLTILGEITEDEELTAFDRRFIAWIADQRAAWDNTVVIALTDVGGKVLLAGLLTVTALVVAYRRRSWRPVALAAVAGIGGALLVAGIKLIIARDRPDPLQRAIVEDGFSFPSGHSTSAVAVLGAVAWLISTVTVRRAVIATGWLAAAALAVGIGLSRIYLGVHYPSDVAAGWLLGSAWLIVTAIALRLPALAPDRWSIRPAYLSAAVVVAAVAAVLGATALTA